LRLMTSQEELQNTTQVAPHSKRTIVPQTSGGVPAGLFYRDATQLPLGPLYDGLFCILEGSTHFFLLQIGYQTNKVSTLHLKPVHNSADTEPAQRLRRGRLTVQVLPSHPAQVHLTPIHQWGKPPPETSSIQ
jgi:hypothetical protein